MAVLLVVGSVAVAILEVDPIVLHRLAPQLLHPSAVDGVRDPCICEVERCSQGIRIRGVPLEGAQRHRSQLPRRIGSEEVRSSVDRVDGLAARRLPRVLRRQLAVGVSQPLVERADGVFGQ